jgi:hypothetical protein
MTIILAKSSYGWSLFWLHHKIDPIIINKDVSHYGLAIYIKKKDLKAKKKLWKLKYFTVQKYNLSKILI